MSDCIHVNNCSPGKVGDTAVMEPALACLAEAAGKRIFFNVAVAHVPLFWAHPWIEAVVTPSVSPDYTTDSNHAFHWASRNKMPFAAGHYDKLGLDPVGRRHYYRSWFAEAAVGSRNGLNCVAGRYQETLEKFEGSVLIAPYGRSCLSRSQVTGDVVSSRRPNLQPPYDWWPPVLEALGKLGTHSGLYVNGVDHRLDPALPGGLAGRVGPDLDHLLVALRVCKLLVTVETGILHLAHTCRTPTLFLSAGTLPFFSAPPDARVVFAKPEPDGVRYADRFDPDEVIQAASSFLGNLDAPQAPRIGPRQDLAG
jgi:hypothetical protein